MDGFRKKTLVVFSCLFMTATAAFSQTPFSGDGIRLGVLPALALSNPPFASSSYRISADSSFEQRAQVLRRRLFSALQAEAGLFVVAHDTLLAALRAHPDFNPLLADSVRHFCQALQLQKLLLPALEIASGSQERAQHWRVMLRWLDAASGEMTKFHVSEFEITPQDSALLGFDAQTAARALINAPELILSHEQQVAMLPTLKEVPPALTVKNKSRRWLWYASAAALLSGGSAYWLLEEKDKALAKRLLPEPPGPPQ